MGEAYFRLLAKEAGFVANSSSDDKAGWDFEVEPPSPAELDFANQSRPVFRIQVKATAGTKQAVSMAFSNLLSLVQFAGPAFVVVLRFGSDTNPLEGYLIHIDEPLRTEILTTLRRREIANPGLAPNRTRMNLGIGAGELINPLSGAELRWRMEKSVGRSYHDYLASKAKWLNEIEEDSKRLRGNLLLEDESGLRGLANCHLGFETPFKASFVGYIAPMGIPNPPLVHPTAPVPITIKPLIGELPRAKLRFTPDLFGPAYVFEAIVYAVPHLLPEKLAAMRWHTAMFDILWRKELSSLEFIAADLSDNKLLASIGELRNYIRYIGSARRTNSTRIEILPEDGKSPLDLTLEHSVEVPDAFDGLLADVDRLYAKLVDLNLTAEMFCVPFMLANRGLFDFLHCVGRPYDPPFSFKFQSDYERVPDANVAVFSSQIHLIEVTVVCFGAFYGTVDNLDGTLIGSFSRSEYLGEIIVRDKDDLDNTRRIREVEYEETLRSLGLRVQM
jgi:hypothetical protein